MNTVHSTYVERNHYGQYVWQCSCSAHGMYFSKDAAEIAATEHERMHNIRREYVGSTTVQPEKRETVQVYYPNPRVRYEVWSKSSETGRRGFHGSFDTFELADSEARGVRDRLKRVVRVVRVTG